MTETTVEHEKELLMKSENLLSLSENNSIERRALRFLTGRQQLSSHSP